MEHEHHPTVCSMLPNYIVEQLIQEHEAMIPQGMGGGGGMTPAQLRVQKLKEHLQFTNLVIAKARLEPPEPGMMAPAMMGMSGMAAGAPIPQNATQVIFDMKNGIDRRLVDSEDPRDTYRKLPGVLMRPEEFDATAKAVFANTEAVFQYYRQVLRQNSIDNMGMALKSSIHFGREYANAFWIDNFNQMVYGDGDLDTFINIPQSMDVAGHEMTHGFISKVSPLIYFGESGALNESCADIFGMMVKQWNAEPKQTVSQANWIVGEGTIPGLGNKGLRSFKNEKASKYDIQPKTVKEMKDKLKNDRDFKRYVDSDANGVHIFSGIPNRAFYEYAKSFGNDSYAYQNAGMLWFQTLMSKRAPKKASFEEFALLTLEVAQQLNQPVDNLKMAWRTVGVLQ